MKSGDNPIPDQVGTWLESVLGSWRSVSDESWPRDSSRVWQLQSPAGIAYVKISPSELAFNRERFALAEVLPQITMTAPTLLAADGVLRTLLTSRLAGRVVRTLDPIPPAEIECQIHHRAGAAIGAMHRHNQLDPAQMATIGADRAEQLCRQAAGLLSVCRPLLTGHQLHVVEVAADRLIESAPECQLGFTHGDFQPRNWLWSHRGGLGLIDFEESGAGYCVEDFGWLFATTWRRRADLRDAFVDGYGRTLSPAEEAFLAAFTALASLQHIADGHRLGLAPKISNGMAALAVASQRL